MNQENNSYGARIERGIVKQARDGKYVIESCDRIGLVTPPLETIHRHTYNAGDHVYFFMENDGSGKIIGLMSGTDDSGGIETLKTDETLIYKDGLLSVNTADAVTEDNTLPITSAAVHTTVGNIEILLMTI